MESPEVIYMDVRESGQAQKWFARFKVVESPWSIETACPVINSTSSSSSLYFDIQRGYWVAYSINNPVNCMRYITPDKNTTKQLSKEL